MFGLGLMAGEVPVSDKAYTYKMSYWNDNFGYQRLISNLITPGKDDGITAAGRFQISSHNAYYTSNLDLFYSILTSRVHHYRVDLLAVRYSREKVIRQVQLLYGFGLLGQGNFGGAYIQNQYHDLHGYQPVNLPYVKRNALGVIALTRFQNTIWESKNSVITGFISASLRTSSSASYLREGIILNKSFKVYHKRIQGQTQLLVGAFNYFPSHQIFEPIFDSGLMIGGHFSLRIFRKSVLALWMTENQYGMHSPHYGVTISYHPNGVMYGRICDILFP